MTSHAPLHAPTRSPLALLADRDADTRQLYSEYLRFCGCLVEEAADGREALAKAIAQHPNVIISDTQLPGIDGFELCKVLHQDPSTREIPFVFVTGDGSVHDLQRGRSVGADLVLEKPCLPETLYAELRPLLERAITRAPRPRLARTPSHSTTEPPLAPPVLRCPRCDGPLPYRYSHLGGVSARHPEQWDYYACAGGCGTFQYRQRTRKLRRVS